MKQMIEHSYKTDLRITLVLWRSFCAFVKDLGSALQLRMFNNRLEKHFLVVLNNNVEGMISPTMHFPSFFVLADIPMNKLLCLNFTYATDHVVDFSQVVSSQTHIHAQPSLVQL